MDERKVFKGVWDNFERCVDAVRCVEGEQRALSIVLLDVADGEICENVLLVCSILVKHTTPASHKKTRWRMDERRARTCTAGH